MTTYGNAAEPDEPGARAIVDLFVGCSLRLRNLDQPGFAASDACGRGADTGVVMENGGVMWRCMEHRGMRTIQGDIGPVVTHIVTRSS